MAFKIGITSNLEQKREVLATKFGEIVTWRTYGPFESKEQAIEWRREAEKNIQCQLVVDDEDGEGEVKFYGYCFQEK